MAVDRKILKDMRESMKKAVEHFKSEMAVSYTHLDVYKRQRSIELYGILPFGFYKESTWLDGGGGAYLRFRHRVMAMEE